jgi:glycosyltransferase involved in cell wall biosynthesis
VTQQALREGKPGSVRGREERRRLAIFTTHPIQYQVPFFRALAAHPGLEVTVLFGSRHGLDSSYDRGFGVEFSWDVPLLEGYEHRFLENRARRPDVGSFRGVRVKGARQALEEGGFDGVLVMGWQTVAHLQVMRAARQLGIPLLLRGESNLGMRPASPLRAALRALLWLPLRRLVYGRMFSRAAGLLSIGSRNTEYYRGFGVPEEKIYLAPYCVDNDWFSLTAERRDDARRGLRARLGIAGGTVVFTSAAKLLARKRPEDLLRAFARLRETGRDVHLVFLGDGPERARIQELAGQLGVAERVTISGFVNQREMVEWYAASDCLVLPSDAMESWGLVVNEAMAAGLPVLVSSAAGCSPDLVRDGENGFAFPCGDVSALAQRMESVASLTETERERMGERSREIVGGFTIGRVVEAAAEALDDAVGAGVAA